MTNSTISTVLFLLLSSSLLSTTFGQVLDREFWHQCGARGNTVPIIELGQPATGGNLVNPGTTTGAAIVHDEITGGQCGPVSINTKGIWYRVTGTGKSLRVSTCDSRTGIKTKIAVFTGTCGSPSTLECVGGSADPDYDCSVSNTNTQGNWATSSTAFDFESVEGQDYHILVMQEGNTSGDWWLRVQEHRAPFNDVCVNAAGPVPRDDSTMILGTFEGSHREVPVEGFCGDNSALYPNVWYQVMGTGGDVVVKACGNTNLRGFQFSVYEGFDCSDLRCVSGSYNFGNFDADKCSFGPAADQYPMSSYTFRTIDKARYYIMINFGPSEQEPTGDFRLYVNDFQGGLAGSGGLSGITYQSGRPGSGGNKDGQGNGNGNGDSASSIFMISANLVGALLFMAAMVAM